MSPLGSLAPETSLTALRTLLLTHVPCLHAQMTPARYDAKYLRVAKSITDADLAAHLAGDITLACVLQHEHLAQVAACDIDTGGEAMVRRVMQVAETHACHAYGFVLDSGDHDGGHVWIFFTRPHRAHDIQVLMRDIVTEARCASTEVYPNQADLRLPFGVHRRCGRRGTLLLHSAADPLDLDVDLPGALATFLSTVQRTSDLPVRMAQDAQVTRRHAVAEAIARARPRRVDADTHWREVIAHFNASTDLVSLLEGYGARAAYHYASGKVLLHCAAGQDHVHGDAHPSLVVEAGRGHQSGRMICGCYSPMCRLHNRPAQVMDAFEVYCRLESISKREAVQRLQAGRSTPVVPPAGTVACSRGAAPAGSDVGAVARPPAPEVTPCEQMVQQQLVTVHADSRVQPLDRRLLAYVIRHETTGQGMTNAALATALGAQPDSIKRSKRRLRMCGYIAVDMSTDGQNPSVIRLVDAGRPLPDETRGEPAEGVSVLPPPFHVRSEITCDGKTPPVGPPPSTQKKRGVFRDRGVSRHLRRRQGVLQGLLRRGGSARQRAAWQAEYAVLHAACADQGGAKPAVPLVLGEVCLSEPSLRAGEAGGCGIVAVHTPHPPLTDAQLTALLRDALEAQGDAGLRALLERVSWQCGDDTVTLICTPRDLSVVTGQLRMASGLALATILPEHVFAVRVQLGHPEPGVLCPAWLPGALWRQVPHWVRPLLVGSVVVDQQLYGATPERTASLVAASETVQWLLDAAYRDVVDAVPSAFEAYAT